MAASLNKVMIIGNVGRDPEMRYTQTGTPVTSFPVAANRRWTTPEGEQREETEWFNVVTWQRLAETCNQYINKGRLVYVEGRLQTRSWEGQDGQRRFRTEVIASDVRFLGGRPQSASLGDGPEADETTPDEIPF